MKPSWKYVGVNEQEVQGEADEADSDGQRRHGEFLEDRNHDQCDGDAQKGVDAEVDLFGYTADNR